MSGVLLEVDHLLPFCNSDPAMADRLLQKCTHLLDHVDLQPMERAFKFLDAFRHANNHLKDRLLSSLDGEHVARLCQSMTATARQQLVKRMVVIWECDDPYTRALACLLFGKFDMHDSVECWYRLRQSAAINGDGVRVRVERAAAMHCIALFDDKLHDKEEWREMMHGIL